MSLKPGEIEIGARGLLLLGPFLLRGPRRLSLCYRLI